MVARLPRPPIVFLPQVGHGRTFPWILLLYTIVTSIELLSATADTEKINRRRKPMPILDIVRLNNEDLPQRLTNFEKGG
jgi:hypothetical protein